MEPALPLNWTNFTDFYNEIKSYFDTVFLNISFIFHYRNWIFAYAE